MPATLSSEEPCPHYGEIEVLSHEPDAVDLSRAADGLPLLFSHDQHQPIGIVEGVRLVDRKLRGLLRFGSSARAQEVFADVEAGILKNVSVGYRVGAVRQTESAIVVTKWSVLEASICAVPVDPTVGVGRSFNLQEPSMTITTAAAAADTPETRATAAERARAAEIHSLVRTARLDGAVADDLVERGVTIEAARAAILDQIVTAQEATATRSAANLEGSADLNDPRLRARHMAEALAARVGGPAPGEAARQFRSMRVVDMARELLELRGERTRHMTANEIVSRSLHTSGDFAALLQGAGDRVLRAAYGSYAGGLRQIARQATARDFRAKTRVQLGEAPELERVNEAGEFKRGSMAEAVESYSLATFGKIFGLSRQALVNDDLDAFADMSTRLGRAAAEFEAKQLVQLLTSNPTMKADNKALFHAAHGNIAATGSGISVTSLGAARKAMRLQTGLDGKTPIDARARFLVVPAEREAEAEAVLAQIVPAKVGDVNPFAGKLELVVEPRLDAISANTWYLAADPGAIDTIEYAYLDEQPGPVVETRAGFDVDGMEFKVRLDFGAGVLDWRGLYRNAGA